MNEQKLLLADDLENKVSYMVFCKENSKYCVPVLNVVEIIPLCKIEQPVQPQKFSLGLLNYNGLLINVIDISEILGLPQKSLSVNNKMMVIKTEESMFAIVADDIENIINIRTSDLQIAPYVSKNFITSVYDNNNVFISILNLNAVETIVRQNKDTKNHDTKAIINFNQQELDILQDRSLKIKNKNSEINHVVQFFDYEQYISFAVSNITFCINLLNIREIIDFKEVQITNIECQSKYLEGIINFRGEFVSVINFSKFIDLPKNEISKNAKLIFLASENFQIALLVDEIFEIIKIPNEQKQTSTDYAKYGDFIEYQFIKDDDVSFIININKLLKNKKIFISE